MSSELKPQNVKAKILEKALTFNSFKGKVKNLSKKLSILGAFQEGSQKDEFIQKYGIQMEMPAIYIYESFFYRPDNKYVINAFCQVFPESITYLDFSKIDKNEDPRGDMFVDQQLDFSNLLCFKVYQMDNNKYQQVSLRKCDSSYQHKITFSADKTKVAIFRLEKNSPQAHSDPKAGLLSTLVHSNGNQQKENIFETHQHYVIDIFDCSSIDFFTRDTVLTPKDPSHIHTIRSKDFQSIHKFEQSFLRFSINNRYFYISQERKTLFFYDLTEAKKEIDQPTEQLTIPSLYECVINISMDEDDIRESLIGVKKTDFRNIEVVPLKMLQEMRDLLNSSQIRSSFIGVTDLQKIARNYPVSSIRIDHFNLERTSMRFSEDKTQVIYCDDSQHILLELAQEGMKQHQKSVHHLKQKTTRFIQRYGDSEFLIATADAQDKCISIRHSSDSNKKIKFYFRFKEGSTQVRDIYHFEDRVRIMVTRDDEEFIIYEYRNFETKEVFWQRFLESSNYIFEWPYLCYLKGQHHIIIQNAFNPGVVFYLELHEISKQGMISNMFVSDQYLLYVVISTDTEYLIYEKDLDKCMPYLFQQDFDLKHSQIDHPANQDSLSPHNLKHQEKLKYKAQPSINNAARPYMNSMLTSKVQKTKPIARVSKEYLGYKGIYKLFVRSPSTKEIIQTNQERIIFFLCNFKIYSITSGKVEIVDTGYKFREVRSNILAYNTVDSNNKKTNEIKYLVIAHSDYQKVKVYEEVDGKLLEYLVQDGQLLTLVKPDKGSEHLIKIYNVNEENQIKLKCQISTEDKELIGNLQTVNYYQNNMIPSGNDLYTIVNTGENYLVHSFKNVIPCLPNSGHTISFYSPLVNTLYRRMIYFVTNKKFLRAKRAIILPYITDNYIQFNKRTTLTQFCNFQEHKKSFPSTKTHQNILCYVPFTRQMLYYNLKGQLKEAKSVIEEQDRYGETTVAVSQNGMVFLQKFEEEISRSNLYLIKQYISYNSEIEEPDSTRSGVQENDQLYFKVPKTSQTVKIDGPQKKVRIRCKNQVDLLDHIKLNELMLHDDRFIKLHKLFLNEILLYFAQQGCEIIYRVNDNLDVLIGFVHHSQLNLKNEKSGSKVLKELFLIKRNGDSKLGDNTYSREVIRIRLEDQQQKSNKNLQPEEPEVNADENKLHKSDTQKVRDLNQKVFKNLREMGDQKDNELQSFLGMRELTNCYDFTLTNDRVIVWSKTAIYFGSLSNQQSYKEQSSEESPLFILKKSKFEVEHADEAQISAIYASGQNQEDIEMKNYYIYIKVTVENSYSFVLKYNIDKNKEFSSFDCSIDSQICFDSNHEGYIFDQEAIIDSDQGIPLYFYKDCMKNYNQTYFMLGDISKGPRFCSQKQHFMIRNRVYLPYSYFCLVLFDKAAKETSGALINNENYDPEVFYFYRGQTVLHAFSNNFKALEFNLNKYHQTKPSLLNMLLIKDSNNMNVLQRAIQNGNTRCVKLILDKLAALTMNNIHAIKWNFCDLLEYNGFEEYLRLCFFQTKQMQSKQNFQRRSNEEGCKFVIGPNETSFLDKSFYKDFQDSSQPMKQVVIRALDAGWILRSDIGQQFQIALSESENMDYFAIETIQTIVNFQWNILKPKIIRWLFIPFMLNMGLYSYYSIYSYEELIASMQSDTEVDAITLTNQILILLFSIQTFYVEYKQMTFHKKEYFRSFWNILDLITVILAPLTVIMAFIHANQKLVRPIMAICNLIFYLRFFYFLRIFDSSSHLVRTIIEITADIKNFIFVFLMAIIGLGGSFLILANNNDKDIEESQFIKTFSQAFIYSYRLGLGDFDIDPYSVSTNSIILHILFILSSLFSAVILLNMLVAIMGESFNRVNETAENQRVREHLQLIVENDFLINRRGVFANVKYLIEIKDDVDEDDKDLITQQICKAQDEIKQNHGETSQQLNELKRILHTQDRKILQLRTQLNEISSFLNKQRVEGNDITLRNFDTFSGAHNYSSRNSQTIIGENSLTLSHTNLTQ